MKVYSQERIAQIEKRFGSLGKKSEPLVYRVVSEEELSRLRDEIESWVRKLGLQKNAQVISRLTHNDDSFIQTYHELAVGMLLKSAGFEVHYESLEIDGKRPDWYAKNLKFDQEFALEVVTINKSLPEEHEDKAQSDLLRRIEKLPGEYCVGINFDADVKLTQKRNKKIAGELELWLKNEPKKGDFIEIDNHRFGIAVEETGLEQITFIASRDAFWVNPDPLAAKIKNKIRKFNSETIRNQISFVIAVVSHPCKGYDLEMFEGAINNFRNTNGLSAAMWCWQSWDHKWRTRVIDNPDSGFPLREGLFPREWY